MHYPLQNTYIRALQFASAKHTCENQKISGTNLPYEVHICNVAMEVMIAGFNTPDFDTTFAVQVALLHDTLEDTATEYRELEANFGAETAKAVAALSKNTRLPKEEQMLDSLNRIKTLPREVWAVKMADRITNLQPAPPHWSNEKKANYLAEAKLILANLGEANEYLAVRLQEKIKEYL